MNSYRAMVLMHKELETHGFDLSNVASDALATAKALQHSILSVD